MISRVEERITAISKWLEDPQRNFQTAVPCILSSLFDDKEPGYREGMVAALQNLRLGVRFSAEDYKKLHDVCIRAISTMQQGWRISAGSGYLISPHRITPEAKQELQDERLINFGDGQEASYCQLLTSPQPFVSTLVPTEELPRTVDKLFETYYQNINRVSTDEEKLQCIARLCRALEILHAFLDGNQRTVAFALLNKLLLENGFPPAILTDPFMFDGFYSVSQMVEQIREGIEFTRFLADPDAQFLVKPEEISERQRGMMVRFAIRIEDFANCKKLLESGAISDQDRGNALCSACQHSDNLIVVELLQSRPILTEHFRTALAHAVRRGALNILKKLLENPESKQYIGEVLPIAAELGLLHVIERLLQEPESKQHIENALQIAIEWDQPLVVKRLLQEKESKPHLRKALQAAAANNRLEIIDILLQETEAKQYVGEALRAAVNWECLEVIERLLQEPVSEKNIREAIQNAPTEQIKSRLQAVLVQLQY